MMAHTWLVRCGACKPYVLWLGSLALGSGLTIGGSTLGRRSRAGLPPECGDDLKGIRLGTRSGFSRLALVKMCSMSGYATPARPIQLGGPPLFALNSLINPL